MPRPSVERATDLSDFFDTDEFALAASYTVTGGSAATVNGVFDEAMWQSTSAVKFRWLM